MSTHLQLTPEGRAEGPASRVLPDRPEPPRSRQSSSRAPGGRLKLFENAHRYFGAMIFACVLGFGPTYAAVFLTASWMVHLHAFLMMLWLVMLFAQSRLVRARKMAWHRAIGRASYAVAPLMIATGVVVLHQFLRKGGDGVTALESKSLTLPFYALVQFSIAYGLAIYYRKRPALHARWMSVTAAPLVGAGIVRILVVFFRFDLQLAAHTADLLCQALLVVLIVKDWRRGYRGSPFIAFLLMHVPLHAFFELGGEWRWWRAILDALHG